MRIIIKNYIIAFLLFFTTLVNFSCSSTREATHKDFPDRYSLELPKGWTRSPKIMKALTDIIPVAFRELKDKEFCTDCKAGYTVKLETSEFKIVENSSSNNGPVVNPGTSVGVTLFTFRSALVVYDSKNRGIVKFTLTEPGKDLFMFQYNFGGGGGLPFDGTPVVPTLMLNKYPTAQIYAVNYVQLSGPVGTSGNSGVSSQDMINSIEQKLYTLRDMIRDSDILQ